MSTLVFLLVFNFICFTYRCRASGCVPFGYLCRRYCRRCLLLCTILVYSLSDDRNLNKNTIWYGGRPRPRRWGRSSPIKGAQPPVFSPCLLWPNGWMDEDATWYGSRRGPRPHCVRRGPSSTRERGTAAARPLFDPCLLWPRSPISASAELLFQDCID